MNQSISALSWGLPAGEQGGEGAGKPLRLPFLTHSFRRVLSPFVAHLFPTLANARSASKVSFCLFPLSECVCFSRPSTPPPTTLSRGAFVIQVGGGGGGGEEEKEWRRGEWVLLFRTDGILCLSGGQNVPARVLLMLNGTGRWIIPCAALSLDKFKGSPTTRHHGRN